LCGVFSRVHYRSALPAPPPARTRHSHGPLAMDRLGPPPMVAPVFTPDHRVVYRPQARQRLIAVGGDFDTIDPADPARPEAGQAIDWI